MAETKKTLVDCIRELEKVIEEHKREYDTTEEREDYWISEYTKQTQKPGLKSYELQEIKDRLKATQDEKADELEGIRNRYSEKVAKIRKEYDALLSEKFDVSPDAIDGAALTMLDSGILSPGELYKLAETFAENPTMLRMIAKRAEDRMGTIDRERQREDFQRLYAVSLAGENARNAKSNALGNFDSVVKISERLLGAERASGFDKRSRESFSPILAHAIENAVYYHDPSATAEGAKETT